MKFPRFVVVQFGVWFLCLLILLSEFRYLQRQPIYHINVQRRLSQIVRSAENNTWSHIVENTSAQTSQELDPTKNSQIVSRFQHDNWIYSTVGNVSVFKSSELNHKKSTVKVEMEKIGRKPTMAYESSRNVEIGNKDDNMPLLVLFTTFKSAAHRDQIHKNVLHNWAKLLPDVQPVLFNTQTDEHLVSLAQTLGWKIYNQTRCNKFGTPYFKYMYEDCKKLRQGKYYAYANGDLLFTEDLVASLNAVEAVNDKLQSNAGLLVIGRRTNFNAKNRTIFEFLHVERTAKSEGKLHLANAIDYFIIREGKFPWRRTPDVVIGRVAYDNLIVAIALRTNVTIVDATKTLMTLHQTGKEGPKSGHNSKSKDKKYNLKYFKFNRDLGVTRNAHYETFMNKVNKISIWDKRSNKEIV